MWNCIKFETNGKQNNAEKASQKQKPLTNKITIRAYTFVNECIFWSVITFMPSK